MKTTGVAAAGLSAGLMASGNYAYAAPSETLRVGLVGCGGRGKGAARDAAVAADGVEIVALADVFQDKIDAAQEQLREAVGDKYKVTPNHVYVGWDAYQQLIDDDAVNYIILATPGSFRPLMLEAAVASGKHTFAEKPVSVDPVGCRKVMELSEQARAKGMGIAVGTQRRHIRSYLEAMQRVEDGAIGEIMGGRIYFNVQGLRFDDRREAWSDMEYQIRNFRLYTHLSGDCPLELLIHQVDVANWVMGGPPVSVTSTGGRETLPRENHGNIFDHWGIDFEYPGDRHVLGMTRRQVGTRSRELELFYGTKGKVNLDENAWIRGDNPWRFDGDQRSGFVQEHVDFIASIRKGEPLNEAYRVAESNLAAIMARESGYTGHDVTWEDIMTSTQDLTLDPSEFHFGPVPEPPIPVPGRTQLNRNRMGEPIAQR